MTKKIDAKLQKYYSEFKSMNFSRKKDFYNWLNKQSKYIIEFEDHGQDTLTWYLDAGGEILHSNLKGYLWNGMVVDLSRLFVGKKIGIMDTPKEQTIFQHLIVEDIKRNREQNKT